MCFDFCCAEFTTSNGHYLIVLFSPCLKCNIYLSDFFKGQYLFYISANSKLQPLVPEAAITVLCTPDDGRDGRPKHVE